MQLLPTDESLLQRALDLARAVAAFASPNPAVGCVLTAGDQVIGEGAHRYDLRDHAEIVALNDAAIRGHNVHGATAYVTLEPCSHQGRTGPCADALVSARVARCIVATVDPNPLVRGQGIQKLRAAGVEVVLADRASSIAQAARRLNDAFAFSIQHGRPFVVFKTAISADGKIAPSPEHRLTGEPFWLTGPAARSDVARLRHAADALLTGIGTVLADDPLLTDRSGQPRRRPLLRVVLDSQLRLPLESKLVRSASGDLLVVCHKEADPERAAALRSHGIEVLALAPQAGYRALAQVLRYLQERQIRSVLTEGGARVNGVLFRGDLVDQAVLYQAERQIGWQGIHFAANVESPRDIVEQLTSVEKATFPHGDGIDLRITGYLHDPWAGV